MGFDREEDRLKKVCKMGLESIWINHADGRVRMCGWTDYFIGKLNESSIEEIWHGEKAEEFRRAMLDGSYRYCKNGKCPYCANETKDSLMVKYKLPEYPRYCNLSYEEACNYVCKFCRTQKYIPSQDEKEKIKRIEGELNKFIGQLEVLSCNGVGELFCSPSIMDVLSSIPDNEIKIELESNGSLFNEKNWQKISNLGRHNLHVFITVHSFHEDTYQFLSGTSLPVDNIISNLYFLKELREKEIINHFEIATVVCERNFREMPEFVQFSLKEFNPDRIRLRFFEPYGVRSKAMEWFYDVRNPSHPYYEEFVKVMKNPVFDHPKIWKWQGENLSELGEHPYFDEECKVKLLSKLLIMENAEEKTGKYFKNYREGRFSLYGNGYVGKAVVSFLEKNRINFGDIFDTNAREGEWCKGHKVIRPSKESVNDYDLFIITSAAYDEIKKTLLNLEYRGTIISLGEFIESLNTGEV